VAFIIRSFAIIGFGYLQIGKQDETTNNEGKNTFLVYFMHSFGMHGSQISLDRK
jgi:hypothetical protein